MRYPLFLDVTGRTCVVVGGGRVATRKIRTLLAAKAKVTVISPKAGNPLRRLAQTKRIRWVRRRYRAGDLRGAQLVIAATDDEVVNRRVCADAKRRNLLVNCIAPPDAGNFIVPAVARQAGLTVAISTGGASPALARQIRRDLEQYLRDGYAEAAKKMRAIRKTAKKTLRSAPRRAAVYRRALKRLLKESALR